MIITSRKMWSGSITATAGGSQHQNQQGQSLCLVTETEEDIGGSSDHNRPNHQSQLSTLGSHRETIDIYAEMASRLDGI
jgi:hypothetical protein